MHEDRFCAVLVPTNTTAAELFMFLNDYISGKVNWSFCVSICMDRAATMTGWLPVLLLGSKRSLLNVNLCTVHP